MRLECVEAFAAATVGALNATLGDEFGRGALRLTRTEESRQGITVHVGLTGAVEGHVALNIDESTALRLYNRVTNEQNDQLPALGIDYFLELGNLISGGAANVLHELGIDVTVHPPRVPTSIGPEAFEGTEACQIPVFSTLGGILVQMVLRTR